MKIFLSLLLGMMFFGAYAHAKLIPIHEMNEWAERSSNIVYCDEEKIEHVEVVHAQDEYNYREWTERKMRITCRVRESFKGSSLKAGDQFVVEYGMLFRRRLDMDGGIVTEDSSGKIARKDARGNQPVSTSRALLFLFKTTITIPNGQSGIRYDILMAKPVIGGKVFAYEQSSNPGPLVLTEQKPENIKLAPNQKYGETELIEDLKLALEKPSSLFPKPAKGKLLR